MPGNVIQHVSGPVDARIDDYRVTRGRDFDREPGGRTVCQTITVRGTRQRHR